MDKAVKNGKEKTSDLMSVKDLQRVIKFCVQADKTPVDTIDIENLISTRQFFGKACRGQFTADYKFSRI